MHFHFYVCLPEGVFVCLIGCSPLFRLGVLDFDADPVILLLLIIFVLLLLILLLPPSVLPPVRKDTRKKQTNKTDNTRQMKPKNPLRPETNRQEDQYPTAGARESPEAQN